MKILSNLTQLLLLQFKILFYKQTDLLNKTPPPVVLSKAEPKNEANIAKMYSKFAWKAQK